MVKYLYKKNKSNYFYKKFLNYFGINLFRRKFLIKLFGLPLETNNFFELAPSDRKKIESFIRQEFLLNQKLKIKVSENIIKKVNLKVYQGFCHKYGIPARGQRSKQNGNTARSLKSQYINVNRGFSIDVYLLD